MNTLMKTLLKTAALCSFVVASGAANAVAPTKIGTFTVDISKLKDSMVFSGCSKVVTVPPDSDTIDLYDDHTYIETVTVGGTPSYINGFWGQVDGAKWSKFRFTLTGNAGEGTGSWATYFTNIQTVAGIACANTTVMALGGTLRQLKGDVTVKTTVPRTGTGTATATFKVEVYGYDVDFDKYGKATETRTSTGTFTWY